MKNVNACKSGPSGPVNLFLATCPVWVFARRPPHLQLSSIYWMAPLWGRLFLLVSPYSKHNVTRTVRAEEKDDEDYISHFVDSIWSASFPRNFRRCRKDEWIRGGFGWLLRLWIIELLSIRNKFQSVHCRQRDNTMCGGRWDWEWKTNNRFCFVISQTNTNYCRL